jgi:hypothetical protein
LQEWSNGSTLAELGPQPRTPRARARS